LKAPSAATRAVVGSVPRACSVTSTSVPQLSRQATRPEMTNAEGTKLASSTPPSVGTVTVSGAGVSTRPTRRSAALTGAVSS